MPNFMDYFNLRSERISEIVVQEAKIRGIRNGNVIDETVREICINLARPDRNRQNELTEEKWELKIRILAQSRLDGIGGID